MKLFIASFNRASDGAIKFLLDELKKRSMIANLPEYASHILAVGDRTETYDCVLEQYRRNIPIIHLWAGESDPSWSTHDEVYRHSITMMSCMQLCTNDVAKERVENLCKSIGKESNAHVVGNVMLDNLEIDISAVPKEKYILILYNPNTMSKKETKNDLDTIQTIIQEHKDKKVIWVEPNGDPNSDMVKPFISHSNFPRKQFLGLMKHCSFFVTNSSCQYYEAQFLLDKNKIISIGKRNTSRESKYSEMSIGGATGRIINLLECLL
jgi:UDP-N-acetylglucosamine 2-epimerase